MAFVTDADLTSQDIAAITSPDALAGFFEKLGYATGQRKTLTPAALGLADASAVKKIELLSDDDFLRTYFVQVKSMTAKIRGDLVRILGKLNQEHLLVLTKDFSPIEFVLIVKHKHQKSSSGDTTYVPTDRTIALNRNAVDRRLIRVLRRLTWTTPDGLAQYDKLLGVFDAARYAGEYFENRALFSDYYLTVRLREKPEWSEPPAAAFGALQTVMAKASPKIVGQNETVVRQHLFEPVFKALGFVPQSVGPSTDGESRPDYRLLDSAGKPRVAALVYPWDRWLDGPDDRDLETPSENPGAAVVSLLEKEEHAWVIVTNGRQWRLYSRHAHSRSTNFYEVELTEALQAGDGVDPNEAFRYFWLFFRSAAFAPIEGVGCWLDAVVNGSRDYAREVERELKKRVFEQVVPFLAKGFLADRAESLATRAKPDEAELETIRQATLTLMYRILFLLYAESRDLLPVREAAYSAISFKSIKDEIAVTAGTAGTEADDRLKKTYKKDQSGLYERLNVICAAMDKGDAALNVPIYNGGLFRTDATASGIDDRDRRISQYLNDHAVPDLFLAAAIDHLARVPDPHAGFGLENVDYKSLGVRQLGSIYEGLLEYKLFVATEDLVEVKEKSKFAYKPLNEVSERVRTRAAARIVHRGDVYLANDRAERKATGSYYTPENIVEYIVTNTVGPVLQRKLAALVPEFRKAEKTYQRHLSNAQSDPRLLIGSGFYDATLKTKQRPEKLRAWAADAAYKEHKDLADRLFDLKVLDPAMGSGHFLVDAVDFVTDKLLVWLNQFRPFNPVAEMLRRTKQNIADALAGQGLTLDIDRLTEVNLLKRHVLKRCIYGVDLNPMAVELAKVSLWLDAFTLGAPLSFLDHHLRCGNSLVGASFADLQALTSGSLFAINYEPMLRAVRNVLLVSRLSDTTAAEVHKSAAEYAAARGQLDGYRLVLDLIVARYFGVPNGPQLITDAADLQLDSREQFLLTLQKNDAALVHAAEAQSQERRFFHWELEFPEVFFSYREKSKQQIERKKENDAGFDCLVGNPPYEVLSELESGEDLTGLQRYIETTPTLEPSMRGKNNLYKLFICQSISLLMSHSQLGLIVPMGLLGNDQQRSLRELIFRNGRLTFVDAFPQKDEVEKRVFEEAKLSTVIFGFERNDAPARVAIPFVSRQHPGRLIEEKSPRLVLTAAQIPSYDPVNLVIASCSASDWDLAVRIQSSGRMVRLGTVVKWYQGEINETNARSAGWLIEHSGDLVVRGASITLYAVRGASQGEDLFLDRNAYLEGKDESSKAYHHRYRRVVMQNAAPQNNFRRLISSSLDSGSFCSYKLNYCVEPECALPLEVVLAVINSKLADWYFRIGSTSADINQYQLDNIPFPMFAASDSSHSELATAKAGTSLILADKFENGIAKLSSLLEKPPFPKAVVKSIVDLVRAIEHEEAGRQDLARSDRSRLCPRAAKTQDALDELLFAAAGLSVDERQGLRLRLSTML